MVLVHSVSLNTWFQLILHGSWFYPCDALFEKGKSLVILVKMYYPISDIVHIVQRSWHAEKDHFPGVIPFKRRHGAIPARHCWELEGWKRSSSHGESGARCSFGENGMCSTASVHVLSYAACILLGIHTPHAYCILPECVLRGILPLVFG